MERLYNDHICSNTKVGQCLLRQQIKFFQLILTMNCVRNSIAGELVQTVAGIPGTRTVGKTPKNQSRSEKCRLLNEFMNKSNRAAFVQLPWNQSTFPGTTAKKRTLENKSKIEHLYINMTTHTQGHAHTLQSVHVNAYTSTGSCLLAPEKPASGQSGLSHKPDHDKYDASKVNYFASKETTILQMTVAGPALQCSPLSRNGGGAQDSFYLIS